MSTAEKFEAWAIVELFGHQRVAGRVGEQAIGGSNFVRVDIPKGEGFYTRLFGNGAIYAINIVGEEEARLAASHYAPRPAFAWQLEQAQALMSRGVEPGQVVMTGPDDSPAGRQGPDRDEFADDDETEF